MSRLHSNTRSAAGLAAAVVRRPHQTGRPRLRRVHGAAGCTLFFTGLSGAGKSTLAEATLEVLRREHLRQVTVLDGDIVREHLSKGLGFSREDRNTNVERIGYVASEVTRHGGIAVVAAIAPYRRAREAVRRMVEAHGTFIEIFVATPLSTCEARDRKGLYAGARSGRIQRFTGISDPYEPPERPELRLDTTNTRIEHDVGRIIAEMIAREVLDTPDELAESTMRIRSKVG